MNLKQVNFQKILKISNFLQHYSKNKTLRNRRFMMFTKRDIIAVKVEDSPPTVSSLRNYKNLWFFVRKKCIHFFTGSFRNSQNQMF